MDEIKSTYEWVLRDINYYIEEFLLESVIVGLTLFIVMTVYYLIKVYLLVHKSHVYDSDVSKHMAIHIIIIFMFCYYLSMLLFISYFSREPGSREAVHLKLFNILSKNKWARVYAIENVILFIPFGLLLPLYLNRFKKIAWILIMGLISSLLIEGFQFIAKRGYSELDDILNNVIGTIIGYFFYSILIHIYHLVNRFNNRNIS